MGTHVALLRGINLGGKNKIAMSDLRTLFTDAGCSAVETFIQSGNVIFEASDKLAATLATRIARVIAAELGLEVPVVLRSARELATVPKRNPFLARGADPDHLHVMFLRDAPKRAQTATLDATRSPGDEFAVVGRDLYLCLPNGVGRTKLSNAYFDRALATVSTGRNWRTVLKLIELSAR